MQIGLDIVDFGHSVAYRSPRVAVDDIVAAEGEGFASAWLPLLGGGPDPLTVCAGAARSTDRIRVATGVLRIWGQHPVELARAASSAAAFCAGRLVLGVGVSHRGIVERTYGSRYTRPAAQLREYLTVLRALLVDGHVDFEGEFVTARAELDRRDSPAVPLAAAAGGTRMLTVAAELADIVVTTMDGLRTLATHTLPTLGEAAAAAERTAPLVAVAVTVCVTDRPDEAREYIDEVLVGYAANPDYRAMLDLEGVDRPSGIAVIGDEEAVIADLERYFACGVGEVIASVKTATPDDHRRTRRLLGGLCAG